MVAHVLSATVSGGGRLQRSGVGATCQVHERLAIAAKGGRVKTVVLSGAVLGSDPTGVWHDCCSPAIENPEKD